MPQHMLRAHTTTWKANMSVLCSHYHLVQETTSIAVWVVTVRVYQYCSGTTPRRVGHSTTVCRTRIGN